MSALAQALRREARVAFSLKTQPLWFRVLKWAIALLVCVRYHDAAWFWPVAAIIGLAWYFAFGAYFWPVYGGTAAGYIAYDWTHYYTHHGTPRGGIGKWLKRYHMLHHHDSPNHRYGITTPLWDFVFGTFLGTKKMARQGGKHTPVAATAES